VQRLKYLVSGSRCDALSMALPLSYIASAAQSASLKPPTEAMSVFGPL